MREKRRTLASPIAAKCAASPTRSSAEIWQTPDRAGRVSRLQLFTVSFLRRVPPLPPCPRMHIHGEYRTRQARIRSRYVWRGRVTCRLPLFGSWRVDLRCFARSSRNCTRNVHEATDATWSNYLPPPARGNHNFNGATTWFTRHIWYRAIDFSVVNSTEVRRDKRRRIGRLSDCVADDIIGRAWGNARARFLAGAVVVAVVIALATLVTFVAAKGVRYRRWCGCFGPLSKGNAVWRSRSERTSRNKVGGLWVCILCTPSYL